MVDGKVKVVDYELADDLQEFVRCSPDVQFKDMGIKSAIDDFEIGTLVKVEKEIGSPITILEVKEADDSLVEAEFF